MGKVKIVLSNEVISFLDDCDEKLRVKILRKVEYVKEFGLSRYIPDLKKVKGSPFWELRVLGKNNVRLFCLSKRDNVWVIYAFFKKSRKTDSKEIRTAERILKKLDL